MNKRASNIRIGPISVITLISILILAALAMLCFTTTRANYTMANRQADSTNQTYMLDACAQTFLSSIDSELNYASSAQEAAQVIESKSTSLCTYAVNSAKKAGVNVSDVEMTASTEGTTVALTVESSNGRILRASVELYDDKSYSITEWKTTTAWKTEEEPLWQSSN